MRAILIAALIGAGATAAIAGRSDCDGCIEARFWTVDPKFHEAKLPSLDSFPENQLTPALPGQDVGVAFSGGGTRAASAALGQMRGLVRNRWMPRVKYMTAVSGGSWAAVPFTYYADEDTTKLLGPYRATITDADLPAFTETPQGDLAVQITKSGLAASGIAEVPGFLPDAIRGHQIAYYRDLAIRVRDGVRRLRGTNVPESTRQDKTFSHMLGSIFLEPLVKDATRTPYSWTSDSALEITSISGQAQMRFRQVPYPRPFLIAGGTMIWNRQGLVYPRLIPVEYTPLYTGVRQQFGNLGGTYVMPWAYDRAKATIADGKLLVDPASVRTFTLADVIGSSGAAPQLKLMIGDGVPESARAALRQAAGAFPSFNPIAVRDGALVRPDGEVAHGDGGFTDNLGLMPLLARRVKHIIAFVNSNRPPEDNDQLQSYFYRLIDQTGSGDKTMNRVFEPAKYAELLKALKTSGAKGPAIACQTLKVAPNATYNIAAYDGLKVCWVYNHMPEAWRETLPAKLKTMLDPDSEKRPSALRHFPYYATFGENKPRLIKLNALQVNLLAQLSCWAITSDAGAGIISDHFGSAVLPRR